jgi:hypothetical protein
MQASNLQKPEVDIIESISFTIARDNRTSSCRIEKNVEDEEKAREISEKDSRREEERILF